MILSDQVGFTSIANQRMVALKWLLSLFSNISSFLLNLLMQICGHFKTEIWVIQSDKLNQ